MAKIDTSLPEEIEQDAQFVLMRNSEIVTLANGFEVRNTPQADSRRAYEFRYGARNITEIKAIRSAWEACLGQVHSFRFKDWTDFRTATDGVAISASDQEIGTGDGAQVAFQLSKTVFFGAQTYTRDIKAPVAGTLLVALDGVLENPANYSLDPLTGILIFNTAPGAGVAVSIGCEFDVWVRFSTDRFVMENLIYIEADATRQKSQSHQIALVEVLE